jgi:hypothetical protein
MSGGMEGSANLGAALASRLHDQGVDVREVPGALTVRERRRLRRAVAYLARKQAEGKTRREPSDASRGGEADVVVGGAAANARRRSPSTVTAVRSVRESLVRGSMVRVARVGFWVSLQVAATWPSSRTVGSTTAPMQTRRRWSSVTMRVRSAWASRRLSKGQEEGRGRGVGGGAEGVGKVVEQPAVLVAEAAQVAAELLDRVAEAREAGPGLDVVDQGGPECGQVPHDQVPRRGRGRQGAAEPGLGPGRTGSGRGPPRCRWAAGGPGGRRNWADQASAPGSAAGQRSASSRPRAGRVRGRSASSRRAVAANSTGFTPAVARSKVRRLRSSTGWRSGRQAR